jgi:hypothetical protein
MLTSLLLAMKLKSFDVDPRITSIPGSPHRHPRRGRASSDIADSMPAANQLN